MDPTSPFSPAQHSMEPEDIPLPETPDIRDAPSATAAVLAASSTVPVAERAAFLTRVRHFFVKLIDTFFPPIVRQGWTFLYTTVNNKIVIYPAIYRYGFLAVTILVALAEWQQPGSIPRPQQLTNAIIGLTCATMLVMGILTLTAFIETNKWPWEEEGWVWPWEKWLWGRTVGDFAASARSLESPVPPTTPFVPSTTPSGSPPSRFARINTPITKFFNANISMPPPTAFKRPIIIPPTPQLPGGMRPPPTPARIHKSGIIGESPMPMKFKHFAVNGFRERYDRLQAVSDWHTGVGAELVKRTIAAGYRMGEREQEHDVPADQEELSGTVRREVVGKGKGKAVDLGVDADLLEVPELIPDT
jgi:hypothetical protein